MASACMTSPSIWIGVALVAAKSQWLILGCSPSPRVIPCRLRPQHRHDKRVPLVVGVAEQFLHSSRVLVHRRAQ
jgi:hypothetical protein